MTVRTGNATHCAVTENGQLLAHAVSVEVAERIAKALNEAQALTGSRQGLAALVRAMENEADASVPDHWLAKLRELLDGDAPDATREAELKYERLKARLQTMLDDHALCVDSDGDLTAGCTILDELRQELS